jgi:hypothetical protein
MTARLIEPPPKVEEKQLPQVLQDWLRRFYLTVLGGTGAGTVFNNLDFTASNITSILTRNHNNLQNIQGGAANDNYHLTQTNFNHATNLGTRTVKSVAGSVDVTLSASEAQARILEFTGVIGAAINVIVPTAVWDWIVFNNTTGAFTLTVKTSGGTGIVVASTKRACLYCDNTNVVRATADV